MVFPARTNKVGNCEGLPKSSLGKSRQIGVAADDWLGGPAAGSNTPIEVFLADLHLVGQRARRVQRRGRKSVDHGSRGADRSITDTSRDT
jgi:hypothetical protein